MSQPDSLCTTCGYPLPETRCPECGALPQRLDTTARAQAALDASVPVAVAMHLIVGSTVAMHVVPSFVYRGFDFYAAYNIGLVIWALLLPGMTFAAPHGPSRRIWLLTGPILILIWIVPYALALWIGTQAPHVVSSVLYFAGMGIMTMVAFLVLCRTQRRLFSALSLPEPPSFRILRVVGAAPAVALLIAMVFFYAIQA